MNPFKYIVTPLALFYLLFTPPAPAQTLNREKLDRFFTWLETKNHIMGTLCLAQDGKVIYIRSTGYRSINGTDKVKANPETKYRIWSVTKMYTATIAMQLVQERKLSMEAKLSTYFPAVANSDRITIAQMLHHTSGIHDFTKPPAGAAATAEVSGSPDILNQIASFSADFSPGERFEYSNSNYLLLGKIIEEIEGRTYADILHARITAPLSLANTFYGPTSLADLDNKAQTYRFRKGTWAAVDEGEFSAPIPGAAGSIVSSTSDMAQFVHALFNGQLVSDATLREMTEGTGFYGCGVMKMPVGPRAGFGHTGGYLASHAFLTYLPDAKLAVAYCTNASGERMDGVVMHVLNALFDSDYVLPSDREERMMSNAQLGEYIGTYEAGPMKITVRCEARRLLLETEGQPTATVIPDQKPDRFYFQDMGLVVDFERDAHGSIRALNVVVAGSHQISAMRAPATER